MRDAFVRALVELARKDKRIELITGDLGFGVLKPFWEEFPDQFTNAGIAEQNMVSVAAGMALEGKTEDSLCWRRIRLRVSRRKSPCDGRYRVSTGDSEHDRYGAGRRNGGGRLR